MNRLVFVYGTLKQGFCNNGIIEDQEYISHATTKDARWQMHSLGGFPGVVSGDKTITGELWSLTKEAFERCDRLEGHPSFYRREIIPVVDSDGNLQKAWIYIYQGSVEGLPMVEGW